MVNFTDYFNSMGLEAILGMSDKEFENYKGEIQEQVKESLTSGDFEQEIRENLLAQTNNNYMIDEELQQSITEIEAGLAAFSPTKRAFMMDIYMSIVNTMRKIASDGSMVRHMSIQVTKLHEDAILPTYAHDTDAAADAYAVETVTIAPHSKGKVPTGLAFAVPHGYQINAYLRSGTSLKTPLMLANGVGVVDAGYRGEMFALVANISDEPVTIEKGERIVQFQLAPVIHIDWVEHEDVNKVGQNRGGGLGSTGK